MESNTTPDRGHDPISLPIRRENLPGDADDYEHGHDDPTHDLDLIERVQCAGCGMEVQGYSATTILLGRPCTDGSEVEQ